jgi:hypothetical protein
MANKVDVPAAHYDRLFIPVACVVSITTVDTQGRVNAASFATCVRVHHEPTCIAFCVDSHKDTTKLSKCRALSRALRLALGREHQSARRPDCTRRSGLGRELRRGREAIERDFSQLRSNDQE